MEEFELKKHFYMYHKRMIQLNILVHNLINMNY